MKIKDLTFRKVIPAEKIEKRVSQLAELINADYQDKQPLLLPILNGSFVFAADLIRKITVPSRVSFVKHASYTGAAPSGQLKTLIGLQESVFGQDILLVEDIMDTGLTLTKSVEELHGLGTKSVEVVTLLRKTRARENAVQPKYVGFEIDNEFVVGYGLDYDGFGRNLPDIYRQVVKDERTD